MSISVSSSIAIVPCSHSHLAVIGRTHPLFWLRSSSTGHITMPYSPSVAGDEEFAAPQAAVERQCACSPDAPLVPSRWQ